MSKSTTEHQSQAIPNTKLHIRHQGLTVNNKLEPLDNMLSGTGKKVWWNVEAGFDKWVEEVLERVTPGNVLAIKFQTKFAFKVKEKGIERSRWDINGINSWYLSLGKPNRQLWLLKLGCWKILAKLHFRDTQVNLGWGLFPGPMIIWSIVGLFNDIAEKFFNYIA